MRQALLALALMSVMLSGCADSAPNEETDDQGTDPGKVEATSTTGGIRGVVIDASINPIPEATVSLLNTELSTTSDENGNFLFSGLEPGTYFVKAEHPIYAAQQTSTEVVAGVEKPDIVKIQLERVIAFDPYFDTQPFKGFIACSTNLDGIGYSEECGEGVGMPCSLPVVGAPPMACERIGRTDGSQPQIWFRAGADQPQSLIVEQFWEPSTSLATGNTESFWTRAAIDWFCDPFCDGDSLGSVTSESPLYLQIGPETLNQRNITPETDLSTFTYSGSENGVIIQQEFEIFITMSYGLPMPEGWSFESGANPF